MDTTGTPNRASRKPPVAKLVRQSGVSNQTQVGHQKQWRGVRERAAVRKLAGAGGGHRKNRFFLSKQTAACHREIVQTRQTDEHVQRQISGCAITNIFLAYVRIRHHKQPNIKIAFAETETFEMPPRKYQSCKYTPCKSRNTFRCNLVNRSAKSVHGDIRDMGQSRALCGFNKSSKTCYKKAVGCALGKRKRCVKSAKGWTAAALAKCERTRIGVMAGRCWTRNPRKPRRATW